MPEQAYVGLWSVLGSISFFGGVGLLMWIDSRSKLKVRQLEHAERLKALECGQPLPDADIARAAAEQSRTRAAGFIGTVVPIVMAGVAIGGTAILCWYLSEPVMERAFLPVVCTIWGVCGLVSFIVAVSCLGPLARPGEEKEEASASPAPIESIRVPQQSGTGAL